MPNWVYNHMTVTGDAETVAKFVAQASKPYMTMWIDTSLPMEQQSTDVHEGPLSFWNFTAPPKDKWPEYFGTNGWANGKKLGETKWNWYNWNIANWGCKWDAGDVEILDQSPTSISYKFETPWSPPEGAFTAMVKAFPTLSFEMECEEEQGWGVCYSGENGVFSLTKEWDIPSSHADYKERDNEDGCMCNYADDPEDWFDDCPDKEEEIKRFNEENNNKEEGNN